MRNPRGRGGFVLLAVLFFTGVGLLFGAGALLLFRYQCQQRLERQHELEKLYAVRSVLNVIRTNKSTTEIPDEGKSATYRTASGRDLRLIVKPVAPIFPANKNRHLYMENGQFQPTTRARYVTARDYEYGSEGVDRLTLSNKYSGQTSGSWKWGLSFPDVTATNCVEKGVSRGAKWWVNLGMRETGGWLQEAYGRRYFFWPREYVNGQTVKDVLRMCLIRNVSNTKKAAGRQHGWPLSQAGERAIVFEIRPFANNKATTTQTGNEDNNSVLTLSEYVGTAAGEPLVTTLLCVSNAPSMRHVMGVQLADDVASILYNDVGPIGDEETFGYCIHTSRLTSATYDYFAREQRIGGKTYAGIYTNDEGRIQAPEMRAVFEVEALSDSRPILETNKTPPSDFLTRFRVTPAYQYDVFIEYPAGVTNRATVAQKTGSYSRSNRDLSYSVLTYDTHGTEHRGFRSDERAAAKE